jgi:hypothetical protein
MESLAFSTYKQKFRVHILHDPEAIRHFQEQAMQSGTIAMPTPK